MTDRICVSIVVPARNEETAIVPLIAAVAVAMADLAHEIIIVDDGSTDATAARVTAAMASYPQLRLLRHASSCGQSAALRSGILAAQGTVIGTLDGDGQNPPSALRALLEPLLAKDAAPNLGLVQGQRRKRHDHWSRKLASRIANGIRNAMLKDGVRDSGCGLKAFRRDVYINLPFFDHIHRFMPAIVRREGYEVMVMDVDHAERQGGRSNYSNLQRALVGIVDLFGVAWLIRRRRIPLVNEVPRG